MYHCARLAADRRLQRLCEWCMGGMVQQGSVNRGRGPSSRIGRRGHPHNGHSTSRTPLEDMAVGEEAPRSVWPTGFRQDDDTAVRTEVRLSPLPIAFAAHPISSSLRSLHDMEVINVNFSSSTTPELLMKNLDHYCEYRRTPNGVVLSPVQVGCSLLSCGFSFHHYSDLTRGGPSATLARHLLR